MGLFSPIVDLSGLRAEFPVLSELAYLNAGTDGPLPSPAVSAGIAELERELLGGRAIAHFERRTELTEQLRASYARAIGCDAAELALTTCTTEGMAQTIAGLRLGRGDRDQRRGASGAAGRARRGRRAGRRRGP
jgi:L-cysteine/cystine lyase